MVAILFLAHPMLGHAASPWTQEATYGDKITKKLEYGFMNFLGGWTEAYRQPASAKAHNENYAAATSRGLYHALTYTVGGALQMATFPFPFDIPLPNGGLSLKPKGLPAEDVSAQTLPTAESTTGR